MHISDLHDYSGEKHEEKAQEFLSKGRKAGIKKEVEQLVNTEFDRLEEYASEYLSDIAARRAESFLERVLEGDDDAAMALLGDNHGGRYRSCGYDSGKPWARLIHGNLFLSGGMELRRRIVEANVELLRNERIADLESIVDGLTQQVREVSAELERCREKFTF